VALELERASDSANQDTFGFEDSGDAYTCKIVKRADGDIRLYNSGGTSITEQTPIAAGLGNTLWVKARCKKGTGANAEAELWYSTNGSSWTLSGSSSNGTWTNQINGIFVDGNVSETLLTDEIRIATSDITIVDTNNTSCP
jgi:hypothetical protein